MTHGHIHFIRKDGKLVTELHAFHDGHTEEAVQDLMLMPETLIKRQLIINRLPRAARLLFPSLYQFEKWPLWGTKEQRVYVIPDFVHPEASNLANWFTSLRWDRWLIVPPDEHNHPEGEPPDIKVTEQEQPGLFRVEWEEDDGSGGTIPVFRVLDWPEELDRLGKVYAEELKEKPAA